MMQLTPHFSLEELCFSQTAVRRGIDNTPPPEVIEKLKRTANVLERVRSLLNNNAIRSSSGYRCNALEYIICEGAYKEWCARRGFKVDLASWHDYLLGKQHPRGEAADVTSPYGSPTQIVRLVAKSPIEFDQIILEYPDSPGGGWVHLSTSDDPRRQVLVRDQKGTRLFS